VKIIRFKKLRGLSRLKQTYKQTIEQKGSVQLNCKNINEQKVMKLKLNFKNSAKKDKKKKKPIKTP
jgi:hypothetical protein